MTTSIRFIEDLRPPTEPLDPAWSTDALATIMAESGGRERPSGPPRPRRRIAVLATAAAVIGAVAVPTVLSSGSASARAELLQLAMVAASADGPVIAAGTYLHVTTESLQKNSRLLGDGHTLDTNRESWIRWDGTTWAIDTRPSVGWTEHHLFPAPEEPSFGSPTPEFIADLPDDAASLRTYLDDTVSGSNSHDEALFVAIHDLAESRMLDPTTFAVALQVLADVDGVDTKDVEVGGRPAIEVSFDSHFGIGMLGRESFTVDRDTAQIVRVSNTDPGGTYRSTTTSIEVVSEVPADVLSVYAAGGNGTRICADGSEARDTEDPRDVCR